MTKNGRRGVLVINMPTARTCKFIIVLCIFDEDKIKRQSGKRTQESLRKILTLCTVAGGPTGKSFS